MNREEFLDEVETFAKSMKKASNITKCMQKAENGSDCGMCKACKSMKKADSEEKRDPSAPYNNESVDESKPKITLPMSAIKRKKKEEAQMEKSEGENMTKEETEVLQKAKELGKDALSEVAKNLTPAQKELLGKVLSKAIAPSNEPLSTPRPKKVEDLYQEDVKPEGTQYEFGDRKDSDLVQEKMDGHNHQGDNSPEGFEGQEVEDPKEQPDWEAQVADAPEQSQSKMAKSEEETEVEDLEKGRGKDLKPRKKRGAHQMSAEEFHAENMKNNPSASKQISGGTHKKLVEGAIKEGKAHEVPRSVMDKYKDLARRHKINVDQYKVKKSEGDTMDELMTELCKAGHTKEAVMEVLKKKGKYSKKAEESYDKANQEVAKQAKTKADDQSAPEPKENDHKKEMKKSVVWNDWNSDALGNSPKRGHNCHWEGVSGYLEKSEAERSERLSKGEFLNVELKDELKKGEGEPQDPRKVSVNDLIEQHLDMSYDDIKGKQERAMGFKPNGTVKKSFSDEDLAKSMGYSEEDIKKIFGE